MQTIWTVWTQVEKSSNFYKPQTPWSLKGQRAKIEAENIHVNLQQKYIGEELTIKQKVEIQTIEITKENKIILCVLSV